jgi:hypothetical protein
MVRWLPSGEEFAAHLAFFIVEINLKTLAVNIKLPSPQTDHEGLEPAYRVFAVLPKVEAMVLELRLPVPDPVFTYDSLAHHLRHLESIDLIPDQSSVRHMDEPGFGKILPLMALPRLRTPRVGQVGGYCPDDIEMLVDELGGRPSYLRNFVARDSNLGGEVLHARCEGAHAARIFDLESQTVSIPAV